MGGGEAPPGQVGAWLDASSGCLAACERVAAFVAVLAEIDGLFDGPARR